MDEDDDLMFDDPEPAFDSNNGNHSDRDSVELLSSNDFNKEEDNFLQEYEEILASSGDEKETLDEKIHEFSQKERVDMIQMRAFLNKLHKKVDEKRYIVEKLRNEQKTCRLRLKALEDEKLNASGALEMATLENNIAAAYRLQAQINRVEKEVFSENNLEKSIIKDLATAEQNLTLAQIEQGKFLLAEAELKKKEESYGIYQQQVAEYRHIKEAKYADQANRLQQMKKDNDTREQELAQMRLQTHKNDIRIAHENHATYFKKTRETIRARQAEEEQYYRDDMDKKIKSVLNLKRDVMNNRENLTALQARDRAAMEKKEEEYKLLQKQVASEGGNPLFSLLKEKKKELNDLKKQQFQAQQKQKQIEIAARVVMEEEFMKKKQERLPYLFEDKSGKKNRDLINSKLSQWTVAEHARLLNSLESKLVSTSEVNVNEESFVRRDYVGNSSEDEEDRKTAVLDEEARIIEDVLDRTVKEGEGLIKPEFVGLWDSKVVKEPQSVNVTKGRIKTEGASKMEQEIMDRVLRQTRENIVQKQIVVGREFSGSPFYSKPEVVQFLDFEVGKTYRKKVTLTNISYSVNYCKLTGLSECLKDFVTLKLDPSGPLSAGMSCDLFVQFQPKIYKDLDGSIDFLSQIGPFNVPIQCRTKKCVVGVDKTEVNFGISVVGETLHRYFTLANKGAKGTSYEIQMAELNNDSQEIGSTLDLRGSSALGKPIDEANKEEQAILVDNKEAEPSTQQIEKSFSSISDTEGPFFIGVGSKGRLEPFSEVKIELIWKPIYPITSEKQFILKFDDEDCQPIIINVFGRSIDVPVWMDRGTVDLNICMYDRLYQDSIIIHNRATTALKINFEVPPELHKHMEILPKTGYVQAQNSFSAQLKFLPLKSLHEDATIKYFDKDTGLLEVPIVIHVANQTRPVDFVVQAVVTNSDFDFDKKSINFEYCTIYESVVSTLTITNKSILPHKFGFVGLPEFVEVQPNDGFGTLLPLESLQLEVIFSPPKAGQYNFELICKSEINRKFKISCQGIGVHPPLELSHQIIHLPATALYDVSVAGGAAHSSTEEAAAGSISIDRLCVVNNHTSCNEFTHPVPRIGNGSIVPVGPTTFEFIPPPNCPVHISPTVGTILPGKKSMISITYSPNLLVEDIKAEACRQIYRKREHEAKLEYQKLVEQVQHEQTEEKPTAKGGGGGGGKKDVAADKGAKDGNKKAKPASPDIKRIQKMESLIKEGPAMVEMPSVDSIVENSDDYVSAWVALMRAYPGGFQTVRIPCYVSQGSCPLEPGTMSYKNENTLYLDVHCPTIRPQLVLLSNNGRQTIDFGHICAGQTTQKVISIQNISCESVKLSMHPLNPNGPFVVRNALRELSPEASHNMIVTFSPPDAQLYQESLDVTTGDTTLRLYLKGEGVTPLLDVNGLDPNTGVFTVGPVLSGEWTERVLTLHNRAALNIDFGIRLDSSFFTKRHLFSQYDKQGQIKENWIGVQNYNGNAVFDCIPSSGSISPGETKEIVITFAPDHTSDFYSDGLHILLFDQEESHYFQLKGEAKSHIMYIQGGNQALTTQDFIGPAVAAATIEDPKAPKGTLLYTMRAFMDSAGQIRPAQEKVMFGCVRTQAVSQKKNGEYSFDNIAAVAPLGFSVDPAKGQLEAGTTKVGILSWKPPANHDPNKSLTTTLLVTLKSDVVEQYRILLCGIVVTNEKLLPEG